MATSAMVPLYLSSFDELKNLPCVGDAYAKQYVELRKTLDRPVLVSDFHWTASLQTILHGLVSQRLLELYDSDPSKPGTDTQ